MIKKYYLDKEFLVPPYKDTYCSCEEGAYDGKYFDSKEDAENYAKDNQGFITDAERLEVIEFEGLFFVVYDSRDGVSKYEAFGFIWKGVEDEKWKGLRALFKHLGVRFFKGEFKALSDGDLTPFDVIENHFDKTEYLGDVINI